MKYKNLHLCIVIARYPIYKVHFLWNYVHCLRIWYYYIMLSERLESAVQLARYSHKGLMRKMLRNESFLTIGQKITYWCSALPKKHSIWTQCNKLLIPYLKLHVDAVTEKLVHIVRQLKSTHSTLNFGILFQRIFRHKIYKNLNHTQMKKLNQKNTNIFIEEIS